MVCATPIQNTKGLTAYNREDMRETMETCIHQIFPLDMQGPAEYCMEDAVDGFYCAEHDPSNAEPDWDDIRKDLLVGKFDCE